MKHLKNFFSKINEIKKSYDKEREKNNFNIFNALHKSHDEVNLHSRFISYLLSSNSGHGLNDIFFKIFIEKILNLKESDFKIDDYEIFPNELNKSEYKNIDILIINKLTKQAIIIENKIKANDSNRKEEDKKYDGYDGQLERYYNTIYKGVDKNGNSIKDFQCDTVYVYYLTMYREKQPSKDSIGTLKNVKVIYYDKEIRQWLDRCINKLTDKQIVLKEIIKQYLMLINKMTHNDIPVEERKKLKIQIAENWESAKYLIDNFKHIKWHTVDDFWKNLKIKLENKYKNVAFFPKDNIIDVIGDITHNNKDINHGILFNIDDEIQIYISSLRGLSWGIVDPKKWLYFKDEKLKDIYFFNFVTENTFRLIDESYLNVVINQIIKEIDDEKDNLFKNLKE